MIVFLDYLAARMKARLIYHLADAGKALIPILESTSTWVTEYCHRVAEWVESPGLS